MLMQPHESLNQSRERALSELHSSAIFEAAGVRSQGQTSPAAIVGPTADPRCDPVPGNRVRPVHGWGETAVGYGSGTGSSAGGTMSG